ncbi:MAG: hypothetical protein ACK5HA_18855 [Planctomycetaceae bacterium]|jgi:hypothetical protein
MLFVTGRSESRSKISSGLSDYPSGEPNFDKLAFELSGCRETVSANSIGCDVMVGGVASVFSGCAGMSR